jgi:hydrogenase expression/formation protein HypC
MCLAIPARLVDYLDEGRQFGKVELGGVLRKVNTTLLIGADTTEPGEYVLVHVGFAMSKVSEEEAAETLELLKAMEGIWFDELDQMQGSETLSDLGETSAGAAAGPAAPLSAIRGV